MLKGESHVSRIESRLLCNLRSGVPYIFCRGGEVRLRHCLHGRGFICNRIGFDAVTAFVYTAPVEFVIRTVSFWIRFQKWSVFKTIRFRGRVNGETASIWKRSGSKSAGSRSKYGKSRTECSALLHNHKLICGLTSLLQLSCILLDKSHTVEKQAKMSWNVDFFVDTLLQSN